MNRCSGKWLPLQKTRRSFRTCVAGSGPALVGVLPGQLVGRRVLVLGSLGLHDDPDGRFPALRGGQRRLGGRFVRRARRWRRLQGHVPVHRHCVEKSHFVQKIVVIFLNPFNSEPQGQNEPVC